METKDHKAFYKEQGYLILREVFSPQEIQALADECEQVISDRHLLVNPNNLRVRLTPHPQTGQPLLEKFDPFSDLSPVARSITQDARILNVLDSIYGEPAVLFKDKLIYKRAGVIGATLHQDWIGWPGFPESFLTVLLAIDPFTHASGATEIFPREHLNGYLSPKDGQHHYLDASQFQSAPVPLLLSPGDVAIFSCFTPHRSAPNLDSIARRGFFISYNALSDGGDQYVSHYREYGQWLRARYPEPQRKQLYFE